MEFTRLGTELRDRRFHLFVPASVLVSGLYLYETGRVSAGGGPVDSLVATCTVFSIPYLLVYGLRIAPWRELRRTVSAGLITWLSGSTFLFGAMNNYASTRRPEVFLDSMPAGTAIYSLLIGVIGLTAILAVPLVVRGLRRRLAGDDAERGPTTPEERVLSDEELDDFDPPERTVRDGR